MFLLNRRLSLSLSLSFSVPSMEHRILNNIYYMICIETSIKLTTIYVHMISTNGARALFLFLSPLVQVAAESLDTCGQLLQCLPGYATEYTLLGAGILVL